MERKLRGVEAVDQQSGRSFGGLGLVTCGLGLVRGWAGQGHKEISASSDLMSSPSPVRRLFPCTEYGGTYSEIAAAAAAANCNDTFTEILPNALNGVGS